MVHKSVSDFSFKGACCGGDFIIVPALFRIGDDETLQDFVNNAQSMLPLLGQKPHVLVLNHPLQSLLHYHQEAITHPVISNLTLLALNNHVRESSVTPLNLIGAPYFQQNHWRQGAHEYRQSFDPVFVQQQKTSLMTASFGPRDEDAGKLRSFVRNECTKADHLCRFVSIDEGVDLSTIIGNMMASWYTLAVPGDFVTCSMTYQALIAGSLLVVFQNDYAHALPRFD